MKKLSILFVSALTLGMVFTSCSKDDDNNNGNNTPAAPSVEGKWNFNKVGVTGGGQSFPEEDYAGNAEGCSKDFIELKADGIYSDGDYDGAECTLTQSAGTWAKTENTITLTVEGNPTQLELASVSDTELKLKRNVTQEGVTYVVTFSFTRA